MIGQRLLRQWRPASADAPAAPRVCAVCSRSGGFIEQLTQRDFGIRLQGQWCCSPQCFRAATERSLLQIVRGRNEARIERRHRIPLGLLLLSRGAITSRQLRAALEAQQKAGSLRIGEWLLKLGYATEGQITRALSIQWGYPMLRAVDLSGTATTWIPSPLQSLYGIVPVHYSPASRMLYVALCADVDRSVFYGMEQMLGCKVQPCVIAESVVRRELRSLSYGRDESVVFEAERSIAEIARICTSYALQMHSSEMRFFRLHEYLWLKLKRTAAFSRPAQDIFFRISNREEELT